MRAKSGVSLVAVVMFVTAAQPARAAVVNKTKFRGNQVATSFFGSTPITCAGGSTSTATVSGFLSGAESILRIRGTGTFDSSGTFVLIDSFFNGCTGEFFGGLSGGIAGGFTAPNRQLMSAELEGSTQVQDFGSGALIPVAIDVSVTGVGPISAGRSNSHTRTVQTPDGPLVITNSRFANANRAGTATGTITVAGITFTPEFSFTTLSFNDNATITIEN